MRIGIDCRCLNGKKTGIGYYTYHLINNLIRLEKNSEFYLYSNCNLDFPPEGSNIRKKAGSRLSGNLWLQTVLPYLLYKHKISVFHAPLFIVPLACSIPRVVTVHDLTSFIFPEKTTWQNRYILRYLLPASIKAADAVIAISENTKKDIVNYLGISPEKISVIPLAAPDTCRPIHDGEKLNQIRTKYKLPEKYILFVGTIEPRKNLERLIKAYKLVHNRRKDLPHRLVVVGKLGWLYEDIFRVYRESGLEDKIQFLGYVDQEDVSLIYNGAELFVYPSLYEGFGLPVLEAMSCGIPVITSNVSSLPEVAGDSCHLVNPLCVEELAYAIELILGSPTLQEQMSMAGLERSRDFSWRKTAAEHLKLYDQVQTF